MQPIARLLNEYPETSFFIFLSVLSSFYGQVVPVIIPNCYLAMEGGLRAARCNLSVGSSMNIQQSESSLNFSYE